MENNTIVKICCLDKRFRDEFERYQDRRDKPIALSEKDLDMLILEAMEMSQAHA